MRKQTILLFVFGLVLTAFAAAAGAPFDDQMRQVEKRTIKPGAFAPPVPANLSADGLSLIEIEVTWRDNANNEKGFEVEETRPGTDYRATKKMPPNSTRASFMYAGPGVKACYRIRATGDFGASEWSSPACAATNVYKSPPPAPMDLKAVQGSGTQINLTWSTETMLRRIEGFVVEYKMVGGSAQFIKRETIRVASIKSSGEITLKCASVELCDARSFNGINTYPVRFSSPLTRGATYCFRVLAFNNAGNSAYTNEACLTIN